MHIYDELKAAGVPLDNHESDLYVKVTPESRRIVGEHLAAGKIGMAPTFTSNIDGARWYDLAFQFLPFWERVQSRNK